MGDLGIRQIDSPGKELGTGLSPSRSNSTLLERKIPAVENLVMAQVDREALQVRENSSDAEFRLDEDSGSEYGVAVPTKRKRRTNNSFAADLDEDDDDDDVTVPPPPKRLQFSLNGKENSALIGVWKDSPPSDPAKKHAVYAFLDNADRIRQKVYPETRDGSSLEEGYPSGTGRSFVPPEYVILDSHLSSLNRQELKEYIRLRTSQPHNESPEERKKAETLAVEEAKKIASQKTPIPVPVPVPVPQSAPSTPSAPSPVVKPPTSTTPKGGIPNGVLLGFWKDSDAVYAAGKHATFGVVDSNRLRIKIIKYTRDGRPYVGNFPTNPGSNWIPFDDVVREPGLDKLLRREVIEYVKLQQNERLHHPTDFDPFSINTDAIKKAVESFRAMASRQGIDAALFDAQREASRKALNESRAAMRANPMSAKSSKYESPYARIVSDNSSAQEAKNRQEAHAPAKQVQDSLSGMEGSVAAGRTKGAEAVAFGGFSAVNSPKNDHHASKSAASETVIVTSKVDIPDGKAKAIRSNKAESDARAEKLRRVREAAAAAKAKESVKGNENTKDGAIDKAARSGLDKEDGDLGLAGRAVRAVQESARQVKETVHATPKKSELPTPTVDQSQGHPTRRDSELVKQGNTAKETDSMTPRQRANKEALAKEKEAKDREAAAARAKMEEVRAEMEKAKADAIEIVSNEFSEFPDSFEEPSITRFEGRRTVGPSPDPILPVNRPQASVDVKVHNDVKYVRQTKGPFSGMLVGENREFLTISGENYVECRILMRMEF